VIRHDVYGRFPALEHFTLGHIHYMAPQDGGQVAVLNMGRYNLDYTNLTRRVDALHELLREKLGVPVTVEAGFVRDTLVDVLDLAFRVTCPGEFTDEMQATLADLLHPEHTKVVFARMEYVTNSEGKALWSRLRPNADDDALLASACRDLGECLKKVHGPGYGVIVQPRESGDGHDILVTFDGDRGNVLVRHVIWQLRADTRLHIMLDGDAVQAEALC
jgi:hypothetical protein